MQNEAKRLLEGLSGWERLEQDMKMKRAFMIMYLDGVNHTEETSGYYEGWLDALDTFSIWIQDLREDLDND
jgi:hypothetical protein